MKFTCQKRRRPEQGYLLLITVTFALIIGIALGSYLLLCNQEDKTVVRSERWNNALAMAEAGADEALAQMNASPANFAANSWGEATRTTAP
jgi:hypothetical protein